MRSVPLCRVYLFRRFERGEVLANANEYVRSRRVGDVTVTAINDGMVLSPIELTVPEEVWRQEIDAGAEGKVPMDIHVMLVQTGDATILIDAGLDDPGSRWDESFLEAWPGSVRT